jgi:hypothetical protein
VAVPPMKTAFEKGRLAYLDGKEPTAVPFPKSKAEHKQWIRGYIEAINNDPLIDDDEREKLLNLVS